MTQKRLAAFEPDFVPRVSSIELRAPKAEWAGLPLPPRQARLTRRQAKFQIASQEVLARQLLRDYLVREFGREIAEGAAATAQLLWRELQAAVGQLMGDHQGYAARLWAHVKYAARVPPTQPTPLQLALPGWQLPVTWEAVKQLLPQQMGR